MSLKRLVGEFEYMSGRLGKYWADEMTITEKIYLLLLFIIQISYVYEILLCCATGDILSPPFRLAVLMNRWRWLKKYLTFDSLAPGGWCSDARNSSVSGLGGGAQRQARHKILYSCKHTISYSKTKIKARQNDFLVSLPVPGTGYPSIVDCGFGPRQGDVVAARSTRGTDAHQNLSLPCPRCLSVCLSI